MKDIVVILYIFILCCAATIKQCTEQQVVLWLSYLFCPVMLSCPLVRIKRTLRDLDTTSSLKTLRQWVSSYIYPTFPPFLVDVRLHSHLKPNNLPLKCESPTSLAWSILGSHSRSQTEPNQGSDTNCWGVRGAPGATLG
jgi:hypothetical protein